MSRSPQKPSRALQPVRVGSVYEAADGPIDAGSFLQKRSYRRRRRLDALRLLPLLGFWLFMVPLAFPRGADTGVGAEGPMSMSAALIYMFTAWCALAALCAILSWTFRVPERGALAGREDRPDALEAGPLGGPFDLRSPSGRGDGVHGREAKSLNGAAR